MALVCGGDCICDAIGDGFGLVACSGGNHSVAAKSRRDAKAAIEAIGPIAEMLRLNPTRSWRKREEVNHPGPCSIGMQKERVALLEATKSGLGFFRGLAYFAGEGVQARSVPRGGDHPGLSAADGEVVFGDHGVGCPQIGGMVGGAAMRPSWEVPHACKGMRRVVLGPTRRRRPRP
jgi:hypothetical protein